MRRVGIANPFNEKSNQGWAIILAQTKRRNAPFVSREFANFLCYRFFSFQLFPPWQLSWSSISNYYIKFAIRNVCWFFIVKEGVWFCIGKILKILLWVVNVVRLSFFLSYLASFLLGFINYSNILFRFGKGNCFVLPIKEVC